MEKLSKKYKKNYFVAILEFWIFLEKGLCQFLNSPIIYRRAKNQKKN